MAIEATNKEDEQKVQQGFGATPQAQAQQNQTQSVTPTLGGAQSSTLGQDVGQAQNQQQTSPGQASTGQKGSGMGARLSNLKKYIETNRGSGMAQKIQGGIEGIRSNVQQGIGQSQTKLQEQTAAEKARIARGETLIQGSQAGGGGVFEKGRSEAYTQDITPTQSQTPAPDYSQYGKTATERLAEFGKYRTGEAQQFGIENELELQRQAQELQKRADLSQSEAGRYQLLRETFNRPAYTTGQQRLDQLLLQAQPEESRTLQAMTKTIAQPVQEQLAQLRGQKEAENQLIREKAQALAGQIGTGLGTEQQAFESDIQKRIADEQARAANQYEQARQILSAGGDINADVLRAAGVSDQGKIDEFLKYYKQGQGQTLGQKVQSGGSLGDQDLQMLHSAVAPDIAFADFKKAYGENTNNFRSTVQNAVKDASGGFLDYRSQGPAVGVSEFLSAYDPTRITAATVGSAEDLARYQALQQLAAEQGGLLQSGMQFGEGAGRIGTFDIGGALSRLREYYNPATTDQYARVSAAPVEGGGLNLINMAEQAGLGVTGGLTQQAQGLVQPVAGLTPETQAGANLLITAPYMTTAAPVIVGGAETARNVVGGVEDVYGGLASGDVAKTGQGFYNIGTGSIQGALSGAQTGVQGGEYLANQGLAGVGGILDRTTLGLAPTQQLGQVAQQATGVVSKNLQDYLSRSQAIVSGDIKTLTNPETLKTLSGLNLASDTGKLVTSSINKGIEAAKETWNKASKVVTQIFCFLKDSQVLMENGSRKSIQDVEPGEFVFGGGLVLIAGRAITDELFCHDGVFVSGSHSTFEKDSWKKVRNSELAKSIDNDSHLVYNLVTMNHLLVVGDKLYTDFVEFHGADLCSSEDEVISKLNEDKTLARQVQENLNEFLYKEIQ